MVLSKNRIRWFSFGVGIRTPTIGYTCYCPKMTLGHIKKTSALNLDSEGEQIDFRRDPGLDVRPRPPISIMIINL